MNKTRQAPSARRIIGMVVGVIIIAFGPFCSSVFPPRACSPGIWLGA